MPDAKGVQFQVVPPVPLASLLPNLLNHPRLGNTNEGIHSHFPGDVVEETALDLLSRLLVYPVSRRLKAADALLHPWFGADLLLPEQYPLKEKRGITELEGKSLGQWIQTILTGG